MHSRTALTILIILAIFLIVGWFSYFFYMQKENNFIQSQIEESQKLVEGARVKISPEEQRQKLLDNLDTLNGSSTPQKLTPQQEEQKKKELLNLLNKVEGK